MLKVQLSTNQHVVLIMRTHVHVFLTVQMLQSDLANQKTTANAVREEGERIIRTQTSAEALSSTRELLRQLDENLQLLESTLTRRTDQLTAALQEVRHFTNF